MGQANLRELLDYTHSQLDKIRKAVAESAHGTAMFNIDCLLGAAAEEARCKLAKLARGGMPVGGHGPDTSDCPGGMVKPAALVPPVRESSPSVLGRLHAASLSAGMVPYKGVLLKSGEPQEQTPHENADAFVAERPGFRVVRGWLVSRGAIIDKHAVVERISTGRRFDITLLLLLAPFFEHPGPAEEFDGLCAQISLPARADSARFRAIAQKGRILDQPAPEGHGAS